MGLLAFTNYYKHWNYLFWVCWKKLGLLGVSNQSLHSLLPHGSAGKKWVCWLLQTPINIGNIDFGSAGLSWVCWVLNSLFTFSITSWVCWKKMGLLPFSNYFKHRKYLFWVCWNKLGLLGFQFALYTL